MRASKEKTIYYQYADKMLRLCIRYLNNLEDAQEVLHNGFLKAFKNLNKLDYQGEQKFENWLKRIMINESLNFLKRSKLEFISIDESEMQIPIDPQDRLSDEEYYQLLLELPNGYRTIFSLYAIEGYSHKEIAELLSISESTSRSQLTKARKLLQKKILKYEG